MAATQLYIIIVNFMNWQDTIESLAAVLDSAPPGTTVIVVDNASGNNSLVHLSDFLQTRNTRYDQWQLSEWLLLPANKLGQITLLQNEYNAGFAAANNLVLEKIMGQDAYVGLINPDMIVSKTALAEMLDFLQQQDRKTIAGAVVKKYGSNPEPFFYGGGRVRFASATVKLIPGKKDEKQLDYISGGCLFTHLETFRKMGLLPGNYFLYWEETDWCYHAKQHGYTLAVAGKVTCFDKGSTTIGKGRLADYYYARNGLSFVSKYKKHWLAVATIGILARCVKRLFWGEFERAKGIFKGMTDYYQHKQHEVK